MHAAILFWIACALTPAGSYSQAHEQPLPAVIFGGIGNVASTATNFLNNAVETPKKLLINASRATTGYIDSAASRGFEFKLRRFLEKFRARMRYGIPELGIPVLEPLHLDEIEINVENEQIGKVFLQLEDLYLNNLSTFVVKRAKLSLIGPRISANLSIPKIAADGHYKISGVIGDTFPLHGNGTFKANLYDLQLYIDVLLGYSNGMYMKTFDLDFELDQVDMDLENFMGGDEIGRVMSKVFQELTPQALRIIKPDILPPIQSYLAAQANETIHHLTMRDIFALLLGQNEIREYAHLLIP